MNDNIIIDEAVSPIIKIPTFNWKGKLNSLRNKETQVKKQISKRREANKRKNANRRKTK